MAYTLTILPRAEKELRKLPKNEFLRLDDAIRKLAEDPRPAGCKKLQGVSDTYRIKSGNYRVLYTIEDRRLIIEVIRIANRKDVYKLL